jgi:hypothetical protein
LGGHFGADSVDGHEGWGRLGDQRSQLGVELVDLLDQRGDAASQPAQGDLRRGGRRVGGLGWPLVSAQPAAGGKQLPGGLPGRCPA